MSTGWDWRYLVLPFPFSPVCSEKLSSFYLLPLPMEQISPRWQSWGTKMDRLRGLLLA